MKIDRLLPFQKNGSFSRKVAYLLGVVLWLSVVLVFSQAPRGEDGWTVLAKVKFSEKFFKEHNEYYLFPLFDTRIRAREGKAFTLRGHYLPMDNDDKRMIIISKYPFSMCFFCGGAGPESVAEVYFVSKAPKLKSDQVLTVTGTLKLNDSDVNHMNFILENARVVATDH